MKYIIYYAVLGVILIGSALATAPSARATLGEAADSVMVDRKALSATRNATTMTHANYTVQQIESDAVTVREYISSSGIVFGVAWNGLVFPDLRSYSVPTLMNTRKRSAERPACTAKDPSRLKLTASLWRNGDICGTSRAAPIRLH